MLALLARQLGGLLSVLPVSRRMRDEVRRCLMDELPDGKPVVAAVAPEGSAMLTERKTPRNFLAIKV